VSVPLELTGLKASTRDGRIRQAISCVLALARTHGAGAVVIEDLDFVAWPRRAGSDPGAVPHGQARQGLPPPRRRLRQASFGTGSSRWRRTTVWR